MPDTSPERAPLSDERLAEIRRHWETRQLWSDDIEDLLAEISRLRERLTLAEAVCEQLEKNNARPMVLTELDGHLADYVLECNLLAAWRAVAHPPTEGS